jgi:hypothetical protein
MFARLATVLAALTLAGTASADPGNGAQVIRTDQCFDEGGGVTFCVDSLAVDNMTTTPSGNLSVVNHYREDYVISRPGCTQSGSGAGRAHFLSKPPGPQEEHGLETSRFTLDCGGPAQTCAIRTHFHVANGEIQFTRFELVCMPTSPPSTTPG